MEKSENGVEESTSRGVSIEGVEESVKGWGEWGALDEEGSVKLEVEEAVSSMKEELEEGRVEEVVSSIEGELVELKEDRVEEAVATMKEELVNSAGDRAGEVVSLMNDELEEDNVEETVISLKEELVKVKEDRVEEEVSSIKEVLVKLKEDRVGEAVSTMKEELEEDGLEEAVASMKEDMVSDEVIQFGEEVPIIKSVVSDLSESVQKEIEEKLEGSKIGEAISIEKTRLLDDLESVLRENEDKTASLVEVSRVVEAEEPKELGIIESSQNQESVPFIRPMAPERTTLWKSCCGLFEVVTGPIDN